MYSVYAILVASRFFHLNSADLSAEKYAKFGSQDGLCEPEHFLCC